MRPVPLALVLALTACVSAPPIEADPIPEAAAPVFDPLVFFEGELVGEGRLKVAFSDTVPVRVKSFGRVTDGVLVLEQDIAEGDKPVRSRSWTMRGAAGQGEGAGRYAGWLSDAGEDKTGGPVEGSVTGNTLRLTFTMDGMPVEQVLTLSRDGRRAYNVLTVRRLGLPVAVLSEDIRKTD